MSEHLSPQPFAEDEPKPSPDKPKTADYLYAFRGTFDREPHGVSWVRVFKEASQTPVIVMGELPQNTSTSVTNMAEYLAPELIQRHFPQRFEELPPAIFLEHYVEERTPRDGSVARRPGIGSRFTPGRRGASGSPGKNESRLAIHTGSTCRSTRSKPCSAGRRCGRCRDRFR